MRSWPDLVPQDRALLLDIPLAVAQGVVPSDEGGPVKALDDRKTLRTGSATTAAVLALQGLVLVADGELRAAMQARTDEAFHDFILPIAMPFLKRRAT
jgi:hypothetical protein